MSLRPSELAQVAAELRERLVGAVVQKAWVPQPLLCFLELRQVGRSVLLCVSAQPDSGRLSIAQERPPSPVHAAPFQHALRGALVGAKLLQVAKEGTHAFRLDLERVGFRCALVATLSRGQEHLYLLGEGDRLLGLEGPAEPGMRVGALLCLPLEGEPATALPSSRLQPVEGAPFPFAQAAESQAGGAERERRSENLRKQMLGPVKARLARNLRTLAKVALEAHRQPAAEEHRRFGELISRHASAIQRGSSTVRLTEYTAAGLTEIDVPLDPKRAPKDQAEWHFAQYRRLLRGSQRAAERQAEIERDQAELRERMAAIEAMTDAEILEGALIEPPRARGSVAKPYKEFGASAGQKIWVGKNSASNDQLTFRIAQPHHLWLHARGVPGSHVVIPLERNAELPQEVLIDAAHLALHHSQSQGEPRGEVSYTEAKFVRKQKGGAPGQVTYTREKTFWVRLEPERLARLLKTRNADG